MKNEITRLIIGAIMTLTGFIGYAVAFKYLWASSLDIGTILFIFTLLIFMIKFGVELIGSSSMEDDEEDYDYIVYVKERD